MPMLVVNSDLFRLWGEDYDPSTGEDTSTNDTSTGDSSTAPTARFVVTPSSVTINSDDTFDPYEIVHFSFYFDGDEIDVNEAYMETLFCDSVSDETWLWEMAGGVALQQNDSEEIINNTTVFEYSYTTGGETYQASATVTLNNVPNPFWSPGPDDPEGE